MEIPAILLLHHEYGKFKAGISSIHRQLVGTLREHLPDIPLYSTVLQANEDDKKDAANDGVELLLPNLYQKDQSIPSLAWLTFDHVGRYPHIPSKVRNIVGHFDLTSRAAIRIKEERFPDAKVILFAHDIPEDTEYYKGDEAAMGIGKKEKSILEEAQGADVVFSLGNKIFDHFENQFRGIPAEVRPQHFKFDPRPSKLFEDAKAEYKKTETMVVLSIVTVKGAEKLMGLDLAAEALGIVAEKIKVNWRVIGVDRDDFKAIREHCKSARLQITPLPYGTLEDICKNMMQAHLVLMPSRAEPFGLIGLEAIAAGVPVLVSSRSGLADLIQEHVDDLHTSIVDMDESEESANAKQWAKNIERMLTHNSTEFERAAGCRMKLLSSEYWKESHQQFIKACTDGGKGTPQPAQVEKRKRSAFTAESEEGAKVSKPEKPPLLPIKVEILEQVKPSVKTPKHMKNFATASEILLTEITMTDETLALLRQVVPEIKTVDDVLDIIESIKTLEKIKGVDVRSVRSGCLAFYLQCKDIAGLCKLWFMYRGGELSNMLFSCLLSEVRSHFGKRITVKATINVEDFRRAMLYILTTSAVKGLDHTTSVDNIITLPSPTRYVDHSSLKGLDLARFSREDQTNKDTVDRDDSKRKKKQLQPQEFSSEASSEEQTDSSSATHRAPEYPTMKEQEVAVQQEMSTNILLVGCKGNGKSHTGNTILQLEQEAFMVARRGGTEKSSLGSSSHEVDGVSRTVTVVDTPGVSQEMTESEFEELVQAVKMVPEGFDAICLVWDYNNSERNEDKEVQVFQSLHRLFGDELYEHLVILVTHAQQKNIPEFIVELPDAMKQITRRCHKVIAIENSTTKVNNERSLMTLTECASELSYRGRSYVTSYLSPLCQIPKGDELGIVLVGKTGVGKSHTGNNITGTKEFTVSDKAKSKTRVCKQHIRQKDRQITVLDTPGVFDTGNVKDICKELCRIVTFFPEGLHAVILVLRRGRFTWEEAETLKIFEHMFGERFLQHSLLLITAKDELESSEEEYLKTAPDGLKNVLERCGNRCVFFNNISKDETILRMQLVKLIRLVDAIMKEEGVYKDDWFESGKEEMNKIIQDITSSKATWKDVTNSMELKMTARDTAMNKEYEDTDLFDMIYARLQSFWHQVKSFFGMKK